MRRKDIVLSFAAVLCSASTGHLQDAQAPPHTAERIDLKLYDGLVVDKRFERTGAKSVDSVTVRKGDEEEIQNPGTSSANSTTIVLRDTYKTGYRGLHFALERSFEELNERFGVVGQEGHDRTSPFEGRTVLIVWDRVENEVTTTFVGEGEGEGDDEEARMLRGLTPLTDLVCFIPLEEVEVGSEWEVPFDLFRWDVLRPCGSLSWRSDPPDPVVDWLRQEVWNGYTGDIRAEYAERIETENGAHALIEFRGTIEASIDLDVPDDGRLPRAYEVELDIEGNVRWDLERGLPRSLSMSTRGGSLETYEAVREDGNVTVEFRYTETSEQTFTFE